MKQNDWKQVALSAAAKVVRKMTNEDYYGWPPVCIGIMYQPVRPQHNAQDETRLENTRQ